MDLTRSQAELLELAVGLARPMPEIPARYFYDDVGAELFDRITELPEYYQTRTEVGILRAHADDIVAAARPTELVELGSGAGIKIRLIIEAMRRANTGEHCVLMDVNQGWLDSSAQQLSDAYPGLKVRTRLGDFTKDLPKLEQSPRRLVLFLAGTFGNLNPTSAAPAMLRDVHDILGADGALLLGLDLVKDPAVLQAAYDDSAGVTAAFNKNMLAVLNRRFGGSFDLDAFEHVAFYDRDNAWIEMRLRASRRTTARVPAADFERTFQPGDEIRTELSCKYTRPRITAMARSCGLELGGWFSDSQERFALALLRPEDPSECA